jgi:hypothetical protein
VKNKQFFKNFSKIFNKDEQIVKLENFLDKRFILCYNKKGEQIQKKRFCYTEALFL